MAIYNATKQQYTEDLKAGWSEDIEPGVRHILDAAERSHRAGIQSMLVRVLASPHFILRVEPSITGDQPQPISDWELASRLSYFLWSSVPDASLREAADKGLLHNDEELTKQVGRMLADERSGRLATIFFGQWIGFYDFDRYEGPNPDKFPQFTPELRQSMYEEPVRFFTDLVRKDRSLRNILQADYCIVDKRLAELYGLNHQGNGWQHVTNVSSAHRGGVLGMASLLTRNSVATRTSPILRGKWVYERVLGHHLPDPPDNVSTLPEGVASEKLTLRERIEAHRSNRACASCHAKFDPLGFALEGFDPIGRIRRVDSRGRTIDSSAVAEDGSKIDGFTGLRSYLSRQEDAFFRTLSYKLLGYALGREVDLTDEPLIQRIQAGLKTDDYRLSSAIKTIVTSKQFRYRRAVGKVAVFKEYESGN